MRKRHARDTQMRRGCENPCQCLPYFRTKTQNPVNSGYTLQRPQTGPILFLEWVFSFQLRLTAVCLCVCVWGGSARRCFTPGLCFRCASQFFSDVYVLEYTRTIRIWPLLTCPCSRASDYFNAHMGVPKCRCTTLSCGASLKKITACTQTATISSPPPSR